MNDEGAKCGKWPSPDVPPGWVWVDFSAAFENVTDNERKLKCEEYLTEGMHPVIDQGGRQIGGYTNDDGLLNPAAPPYIVFGDHTRCFKYVPHRFVQGADGVKVFRAKGIDPKYGYWAMKTMRLPDRGYSRHFQFVRSSRVPIAPLPEQRRIVAKIEDLFSGLDVGVAALLRVRAKLKRYRAAALKAAVTGKLTEEWRKRNCRAGPDDRLLKLILQDRRKKWEQEQIRKCVEAGKSAPTGLEKKYVEPLGPSDGYLPQLPDTWKWCTADQLCAQITDGEHIQPPYKPTGRPLLTATHVRNSRVEFKNAGLISHEDFAVIV